MIKLRKYCNNYKTIAKVFKSHFTSVQPVFTDSIYAIASGNVKAGVVSGQNCLQACQLIDPSQESRDIIKGMNNQQIQEYLHIKNRYAHYKKFYSLKDRDESQIQTPSSSSSSTIQNTFDQIDQGIFMYFKGPKSYTGEDVVEMHIHGSRALQKKVLLELSLINHFRLAEPGEFTKRALLNNKLDLLEVEGLSDLLNSETETQRVQSTKQFLGHSSQILENWRFQLIRALAHAEAFIDFESDQDDVEFNILGKTQENVKQVIKEIKDQLADKNRGEILRDGMKISIIGKPNSGKSTLLNCLAKKDIAIVSEIPGTTRDALSISLNISGFPIIIYDTAGIRQTTDLIEEKGVNKAIEHAKESDINIWIIDVEELKRDKEGNCEVEEMKEISELIEMDMNTLIFVNKMDKIDEKVLNRDGMIKIGDKKWEVSGYISAQHNHNISHLLDVITNKINQRLDLDISPNNHNNTNHSIITQARHRIQLQQCLNHLDVFSTNSTNLPVDIVCEELRQAVNSIGRITGRVDVEEVLDVLFAEFCIGK